jgi:citrate synthase
VSIIGPSSALINVDLINVDQLRDVGHDHRVTLYVGAAEAARRLGVTKATLYAYASRRLIERRRAVDGRSSLYAVDDVERLAARGRQRQPVPRPTIDVQITSAITRLDDEGLSYRGHDVVRLAATASYEQVAELLWTGGLPVVAPAWDALDPESWTSTRAALAALPGGATELQRMLATVPVLAVGHEDDPPSEAARRLIIAASMPDRRRGRGTVAERLARSWHRHPTEELCAAIDLALVLLADHELATSTLAVRIAASVRADAYASLAAGIATVSGRLHGSAAAAVHGLIVEAAAQGARTAIARRREIGQRLPGFGHTIYRSGDPRLAPLLAAVRTLADPHGRMRTVEDLLGEAGRSIVQQPNVDFGLGALAYVAGLGADVPLFAIARLAGWAAHAQEELVERPVRFRGLARNV